MECYDLKKLMVKFTEFLTVSDKKTLKIPCRDEFERDTVKELIFLVAKKENKCLDITTDGVIYSKGKSFVLPLPEVKEISH